MKSGSTASSTRRTMSNLIDGVIVGIKGGFAEVGLEGGPVRCKIRGKLRLMEDQLIAGDYVRVDVSGGEHLLSEVLPRRNSLVRPPVANVDCVAIFTPLRTPEADLMLTDRLCILGEKQGLSVIICATKADIGEEGKLCFISEHYKAAGYEVVSLAAPRGEGVQRLRDFLKGRVSIFAGQSGAGKSTLINAMLPGLELKTAEVSERIGRGKHTTRQVRLIPLGEGSYVADSPGFSSLELEGIGPDELRELMPDVAVYEGRCRFSGCRHSAEPGCGLKEAVSAGSFSRLRYEHYIAFLGECLGAERRKYD